KSQIALSKLLLNHCFVNSSLSNQKYRSPSFSGFSNFVNKVDASHKYISISLFSFFASSFHFFTLSSHFFLPLFITFPLRSYVGSGKSKGTAKMKVVN